MTGRVRLADESGLSLSEMLVVIVILGIVIGALTQLFTAAVRTQALQSDRFRAQQDARLALDGLRREIHCANAVTTNGTTAVTAGDFPRSSIVVNLGSYCATGSGNVTWCTIAAGSTYALWRTPGTTCTASGGIRKAEYLTASSGQVFSGFTPPGGGLKAKLSVSLPVDLSPTTVTGRYELQDDLVLRNSSRS